MKTIKFHVVDAGLSQSPDAVIVRIECPESIDGASFLADASFLGHLRPGEIVTVEFDDVPDADDEEAYEPEPVTVIREQVPDYLRIRRFPSEFDELLADTGPTFSEMMRARGMFP